MCVRLGPSGYVEQQVGRVGAPLELTDPVRISIDPAELSG
jgi:hypothetical protein